MTIKTTRFSPDTCGCVIEYQWDDTLTESQRTHTLSNYLTKCSAHSSLATDQDRWNAVFEENPRKNITLQGCLDNGPTALFDTINGTRQLKAGISYNWSWSGTAPNRVLNISFSDITLTTQQKNTIQNALNTRFGSGKVNVV